jgi:EmrB/QacA subfamily drug resistance transporter
MTTAQEGVGSAGVAAVGPPTGDAGGGGDGGDQSRTILTAARKRVVLAIACMSTFLVNLDNTIVNVALPDIRAQLHPSVSGLQWIVDSYLMTLAALLILSGSIGDRFGRRRIFGIGLIIFAFGSLLSSLAPAAGWLVGFRVLQAVGASMLNPVAMSIISNVFVHPRARTKAFGIWGGAVGLGMASGPVIGGLLTQAWGWRSVFWAVVPLAVGVAVCARMLIPESKSHIYRKPDLLGQALVLTMLTAIVFTIIEIPRLGIGSLPIQAGVVVAVMSVIALGVVESRVADPLIEFRFFRSVPFSASMLIAILVYSAMGGFLFINTIYLQDVRGYGPFRAGLYILPMALGTAGGAKLAAWLVSARGATLTLVAAGACITGAAMIIFAVIGDDTSTLLLIGYSLLGLGFGGANTPVNNTAMAGMPRSQAGVAGALASSSRQVGQSLGVAVFGSIINAGAGVHIITNFTRASLPGWYIITGIGLSIIALGIIANTRTTRQSAQ